MLTYEDQLRRIAGENSDVVVLTAENRASIRNISAIPGFPFVDFGIAEQTMIGASAGLALRGRIPIAHALATFLTMRAFEFIRTDIGIAGLPVKLVGAVPGFLSEANGPTHQAIEDISLMRSIPGMQIVCPADGEELVEALPVIVASPNPCYIRYNAAPASSRHHQPFEFGKAEILSTGHDVGILTYGFMVREVLQAADILESHKYSVHLVNMRSLQPVDETTILNAAEDTGMLVTIEDHLLVGGLYSIVCEVLTRHRVRCDVLPIGLDKKWFRPALLSDVLDYEGFTGEALAERITNALSCDISTLLKKDILQTGMTTLKNTTRNPLP